MDIYEKNVEIFYHNVIACLNRFYKFHVLLLNFLKTNNVEFLFWPHKIKKIKDIQNFETYNKPWVFQNFKGSACWELAWEKKKLQGLSLFSWNYRGFKGLLQRDFRIINYFVPFNGKTLTKRLIYQILTRNASFWLFFF